MSNWEIVIGFFSMLGLGSILPYIIKRLFPTKAALVGTLKSAIDIHEQLNHQMEELVEEKTQGLQNILIRREGEFHLQIKEYAKQIFSLQELNRSLQEDAKTLMTEISDYQKQILLCYKDLTEERKLKEQYYQEKEKYYEELQEAKVHIDQLEKRVEDLEKNIK